MDPREGLRGEHRRREGQDDGRARERSMVVSPFAHGCVLEERDFEKGGNGEETKEGGRR